MTDRERILTHVIQTMLIHKDEIKKNYFTKKSSYTKGNILIAITNYNPSNWTVSSFEYYDEEKGCCVVKDIVTGKLCNYYNESFAEIKKEWLSKYELLLGKKYKIYHYCDKYGTGFSRFYSLEFNDEDKTFTFKTRLPFHNEANSEIKLSMDLPLKKIREELEYGDSWIELKAKD